MPIESYFFQAIGELTSLESKTNQSYSSLKEIQERLFL